MATVITKYGNAIYTFRQWIMQHNNFFFTGWGKTETSTMKIDDYKFYVSVASSTLDVILESPSVVALGIHVSDVKAQELIKLTGANTTYTEADVGFKIKDSFRLTNGSTSHMVIFRLDIEKKSMDYLYETKGVGKIKDFDIFDVSKYKIYGNIPDRFDFSKFLEPYFKS